MINLSILRNLIDSAVEMIEYFWLKFTQTQGNTYQYPFFALILMLCVGKIVLDLFNKLR